MNNLKPIKSYFILLLVFLLSVVNLHAQEVSKEVKKHLAEAASQIESDNFAAAEAAFRKALSADPDNDIARYNFGNLYLKNDKQKEAFINLAETVQKSENRQLKHKSFHNQGNMLMEEERYGEAVEAYKNALRMQPNDDETRYNLALAKKKQEEDGGGGGDDDDQEDEQEQPQDDQGEGEDEDEDNQDNQDQDQKDQGDEGDQEDEDKEGEGEQDNDEEGEQEQEQQQPQNQGGKDEEKEGEQQEQKPQQVEGKLSPEQIQNLLEAIENKEKDTQDKVNKKEEKGERVRTEKDW